MNSRGIGLIYIHSVTLANITVPHQQFALVDKAAFAGDGVSSGILGLGLKGLTSAYTGRGPVKGTSQNLVRYSSIMETMAASGVADPLFTIAMSRDPDRSHIAFGGIPPVETKEYVTVPIQKVCQICAFITRRPERVD